MQFNRLRRREFITLIGGAAAAWPLAARAQQQVTPIVGYLSGISPEPEIIATFLRGLGEIGFIDGQNVIIEYRFAEGQYARLSALATDLVRRQVAAIVTGGGDPPIIAAKAATDTIPIVFNTATDPTKLGLVASLNRPASNITGVSTFSSQLGAKSRLRSGSSYAQSTCATPAGSNAPLQHSRAPRMAA
jgi:putative tryptophan/tyrosine transport system substrate-binding protein